MSEPLKKPGHTPESYQPKKPEIVGMVEQVQGQTEPQGASQATSSSGGSGSIPGIRGVWDGGKGHNFGLPDCLAFIWERLNETVKLDFWDFAAVAGDSVAMVYNRNPSTHCGYSVSGYLAGPEHTAHVFDAIGYAHDYVTVTQINANKGKYLQQVMHYIDHGLPVLALTSLADVPGWKSDVADYCLIVGYDNGGQTLLLNIDEKDGEAQLLPHGVSGDMKMDLIFIGDKQREITMEELYLGAVKNMTHWLTLPERDGMFFGAAAFRTWADDIEAGRYKNEKAHLWDDYGVYVCNLATSPAIPFFIYKKLAKMNPAYSHYMALYDEIAKLFPAFKSDDLIPGEHIDGLWSELEHLGGGFNVKRKVVRNKKRRGKIAAALRDYAERLDQLVRILEKGGHEMNDPVKKPGQQPESYQPKKPEIVGMVEECSKSPAIDPATLPRAMTIDGLMSPDDPWIGGCRYLLCFTPLFMHIEKSKSGTDYYADPQTREDCHGYYGFCDFCEGTDIVQLNRERIYKVFLTVTGMGLSNAWDSAASPSTALCESAKDYIGRSMRFSGYDYEIVQNTGRAAIMDKIKIMINVDTPVLARYKSGWELIIGYEEGAVILRKKKGIEKKKDYANGLEYLVCITGMGRERSDLNTVITDIIETMEAGVGAYHEAAAFFVDDAFFAAADKKKLKEIKQQQVWDYFIGHAEQRGFSGMGFAWRFLNRAADNMDECIGTGGKYGDIHHQIAWGGDHVLEGNAENLRRRIIRDKMIYINYAMMENDRIICRALKENIGMDTPDLLVPPGGRPYAQIQTSEASLDEIAQKIKAKSTTNIDFSRDIKPWGKARRTKQKHALRIHSEKEGGFALKTDYALPLKIDMRAKSDSRNIRLYYKLGNVKLEGERHLPGQLRIADIDTTLDLGHVGEYSLPADKFVDLTWILHRDFMAVTVDGAVCHYGTGWPYMNIGDMSPGTIRFGTADGSTITVEALSVSEL